MQGPQGRQTRVAIAALRLALRTRAQVGFTCVGEEEDGEEEEHISDLKKRSVLGSNVVLT